MKEIGEDVSRKSVSRSRHSVVVGGGDSLCSSMMQESTLGGARSMSSKWMCSPHFVSVFSSKATIGFAKGSLISCIPKEFAGEGSGAREWMLRKIRVCVTKEWRCCVTTLWSQRRCSAAGREGSEVG